MDVLTRLCISGARTWVPADAALLDVSRTTLWRSAGRGHLTALGRGLYGLPGGAEDALSALAFAFRGVASHQTAAAHWGIELAAPCREQHVTVGRNRSRVSADGVVVHRVDLPVLDVPLGHPVTTPLRTIIDLSRVLPLGEAVAAADSALRQRLVTLEELRAACAVLPPAPGRRRVRRVIELVDPRAESVLESLLRVVLVEAGLAPDDSQVTIRDRPGRFVGRVDLWYVVGLVVEADGFAFHSERSDYRRDRRLGNALEVLRVGLLRFTWEDIVGDPGYVIATVRDVLAGATSAHDASLAAAG